MRTESEILEKYKEMMEHTIILEKIKNNPPENTTYEDIIYINNELNSQYQMNALIDWILNK